MAGRPDPDRPGRQLGPAGRVLVIMLVCLLGWALLAAPGLRRSAEASSLGMRRTVSMAVLFPLARLSEALGLDRIQDGADRALGRTPHVPQAVPSGLIPSPKRTIPPKEINPTPTFGTGPDGLPLVTPILQPPTVEHPLTVLTIGDSIGADLSLGLSRVLEDQDGLFVGHEDAREATGLSRPDYFNWPYQVALDIRSFRPDLVVAMFGANDAQGFIEDGRGYAFGTQGWKRIYAGRVATIMEEATQFGAPVVWVGMPIMRSPTFSRHIELINAIGRTQASKHPGVLYVPTVSAFVDAHGQYSAYLTDDSGDTELVRQPDGIHLTVAGSVRLAEHVFRYMELLWGGPAASPSLPAGSASP
jgi:uncharacterized protein